MKYALYHANRSDDREKLNILRKLSVKFRLMHLFVQMCVISKAESE